MDIVRPQVSVQVGVMALTPMKVISSIIRAFGVDLVEVGVVIRGITTHRMAALLCQAMSRGSGPTDGWRGSREAQPMVIYAGRMAGSSIGSKMVPGGKAIGLIGCERGWSAL